MYKGPAVSNYAYACKNCLDPYRRLDLLHRYSICEGGYIIKNFGENRRWGLVLNGVSRVYTSIGPAVKVIIEGRIGEVRVFI